jgi:hypothetical protein
MARIVVVVVVVVVVRRAVEWATTDGERKEARHKKARPSMFGHSACPTDRHLHCTPPDACTPMDRVGAIAARRRRHTHARPRAHTSTHRSTHRGYIASRYIIVVSSLVDVSCC